MLTRSTSEKKNWANGNNQTKFARKKENWIYGYKEIEQNQAFTRERK
jgi:hypothetical protein